MRKITLFALVVYLIFTCSTYPNISLSIEDNLRNDNTLVKLSPPLNLQFTMNNEGIHLAWFPPEGVDKYDDDVKYKVYRGSASDELEQLPGLSPQRKYLDRKVKLGKVYYYAVTASKGGTESEFSNIVKVRYVESGSRLPTEPLDFEVNITQETISFYWKRPSESNGFRLLGYYIYAQSGGEWVRIIEQKPTQLDEFKITKRFSDLQVVSDCYIISAYSEKGEGFESEIACIGADFSMSAPLNFKAWIDQRTADYCFSWFKPTSHEDSEAVGYTVYSQNDEGTWDVALTIPPTSSNRIEICRERNVDNACPGPSDFRLGISYFYFRVAVTGCHAYSAAVITPDNREITPPKSLFVKKSTTCPNEYEFSWKRPVGTDKTKELSYYIYTKKDGQLWHKVHQVESAERRIKTKIEIDEKICGNCFFVVAGNYYGKGFKSNTYYISENEGLSSPLDFAVSFNTDDEKLYFEWSRPNNDDGCSKLGYIIYSFDSGYGWKEIAKLFNKADAKLKYHVTLKDIKFEPTRFKILAFSTNGLGPESNVISLDGKKHEVSEPRFFKAWFDVYLYQHCFEWRKPSKKGDTEEFQYVVFTETVDGDWVEVFKYPEDSKTSANKMVCLFDGINGIKSSTYCFKVCVILDDDSYGPASTIDCYMIP